MKTLWKWLAIGVMCTGAGAASAQIPDISMYTPPYIQQQMQQSCAGVAQQYGIYEYYNCMLEEAQDWEQTVDTALEYFDPQTYWFPYCQNFFFTQTCIVFGNLLASEQMLDNTIAYYSQQVSGGG